jgi:hypothetical protein
VLLGPASKYRAIEADTVAAGMIAAALGPANGRNVYHFHQIRELARAMKVRRAAEV